MTTSRAVRCYCGKVHTVGYVSVTSRCSCGALLWPQVWAPTGGGGAK